MAKIFIYNNDDVVQYDIEDDGGTVEEMANLLNAKSLTTTIFGDYTIIDGGGTKAEDGLYFISGTTVYVFSYPFIILKHDNKGFIIDLDFEKDIALFGHLMRKYVKDDKYVYVLDKATVLKDIATHGKKLSKAHGSKKRKDTKTEKEK